MPPAAAGAGCAWRTNTSCAACVAAGRPFAAQAEIIRGRYESATEMMLPDPIHPDARCQRMLGRSEPVGQVEPRQSPFVRSIRNWNENAREGRHHFAGFALHVATAK